MSYSKLTERNIGIITQEQQDKLKNAKVAIFGMANLGQIIAQLLARTGISNLSIYDSFKFEKNNLNRQVYAFHSTLGKRKIDVTEKFLKGINPELNLKKYSSISKSNILKILSGCDLAIVCMDDVKDRIIVSREARRQNIPIVEGWPVPFSAVRLVTNSTPSIEKLYNLPTYGKDLDSFDDNDFKKMQINILLTLSAIHGIRNFYSDDFLEDLFLGKIAPRSFAPIIWSTATMMATEAIKYLINMGRLSLAPKYSVYDPFSNKLPRQVSLNGFKAGFWIFLAKRITFRKINFKYSWK